ncbi:class I SAM-dependent methyltransferase [Methylocaldum sp.]|uniref:class I SAM-dependent methyltransferase n=1 Tax=Methylocaldum sp. TaxID=1969727 RepID=UPI002D7052D5|nr:class I SAM-dependent methyltransferase [Methylocaldum sp.]HYE36900.1 class I SAM-dependent methyltransferase [Methylocaldum sp.]
MDIHFHDYLEAKFALDERSLNPDVKTEFARWVSGQPRVTCLDLGTGTGASVRRLLNLVTEADLHITAVDRDPTLLGIAQERMADLLRHRGFDVSAEPTGIRARQSSHEISIDFVCSDLQHFAPNQAPASFDAVITHAVMDLLPLRTMAERIARWLRPKGLFYSTINYDGETALFPVYRDEDFESRILALYDTSMEERRVWDENSGGARSGRRLHRILGETGFEPIAYGSSDWNITPLRRTYYRDRDAVCLTALLNMIRDEAIQSGQFPKEALDQWHRERSERLETRELGLIIHQIDVLAEKV